MEERRHGFVQIGERVASVETEVRLIARQVTRLVDQAAVNAGHFSELLAASREQTGAHEVMHRSLDDVAASLKQHDARDDARFESLGSQITTLEKRMDAQEITARTDDKTQTRRHERATALHAAIIGLIGALIGGMIIGLPAWFAK